MKYGSAPEIVDSFSLDEWSEYMHYMYLPIKIPNRLWRMPRRLQFLNEMILAAVDYERLTRGFDFDYIYVTARRGYATPGNPLNRPGWHSDGFGTNDVNYVWADAYPTLFAEQDFHNISDDHVRSAQQFHEQLNPLSIATYPNNALLRLDASVIHAAPEIPEGGERGFVKISFSNSKYNLRGNSHNHLLDYAWEMHDRNKLRNDPAYAGGDAGPQVMAHA